MKKILSVCLFFSLSFSVFAGNSINIVSTGKTESGVSEFRLYDQVLEINDEVQEICKFYGLNYQEYIPVEDYASISKKNAFEAYLSLAEKKDPFAMWVVAVCYRDGTGTETDKKLSEEYFISSINEKFVPAEFFYADFLFDKNDFSQAYIYLKQAADKGFVPAMTRIGTRYIVPSFSRIYQDAQDLNISEREKYLKKAADNGDGKAAVSLGDLYLRIKKGKENKAREFYERAVENGNNEGNYKLFSRIYGVKGLTPDIEKARKYYERYLTGEKEAEEKSKTEKLLLVPYWEELAEQGDPYAMYDLAEYYLSEEKNIPFFEYYLRLAADSGCTAASEKICLYRKCDPSDALKYAYMAGKNNEAVERAIFNLYVLALNADEYFNLLVADENESCEKLILRNPADDYSVIDEAEAFSYIENEAKNENRYARQILAFCYHEGIFVEQNLEKSEELGFINFDGAEFTSKENRMKEVILENELLEEKIALLEKQIAETEEALLSACSTEKKWKENGGEEFAEENENQDSVEKLISLYRELSDVIENKNSGYEKYAESYKYLEKAALLGDASSCADCAWYLNSGALGKADQEKAFDYLMKSAVLGNSSAMLSVARSYAVGAGTNQDINASINWLILAYNNGLNGAVLKEVIESLGYENFIREKFPECESEPDAESESDSESDSQVKADPETKTELESDR